MVTFTKLKDASAYNTEFLAEVKRIGRFDDMTNGPDWVKVTSNLGRDLLAQFAIYETESKEYFTWLDKQFPVAKALTAEAIQIATNLGKTWSDSEHARLKLKKAALDDIITEISALRKAHTAHQGFRGTFGFKQSAGGSPNLEKIEETVLVKRKVYIDKGTEVGPAVDKLRNEYGARVDTALKLAEKYKAAGDKKIVTAHNDLELLAKQVTDWLNPKSASYNDINSAADKIERDIAEVKKLKKPTTKADFDSRRPTYTILAAKIAVAKTKVNTDFKTLEILSGTLGASMFDKNVLDQKLVKLVVGGFDTAKAKFKTLEVDMTKEFEAQVLKYQKAVVK